MSPTAQYTDHQQSEAVVKEVEEEVAENGVKYPGLLKVKQTVFCLPTNIEIFYHQASKIQPLYLSGKY